MHYKNGREAKPGDIVVHTGLGILGVLNRVQALSTSCNGRLSPMSGNDPYVTIGECLHVDDIAAATIPDSSAPPAATA